MQEQCEAREEMLHRLNRRLRTLSQCNSTCFQAESEQELLQSICEILVAGGECRLAWIGYCEHDAEQTVRPVAQAGDGLDYLERVKMSWGEAETGQGPAGIAVRTGKACWVNDTRTDPRFAPWRGAALARGYASCIAVPLIAYGKSRGAVDLHGTLNLYSAECNAFDEHTIDYYTGLAASVTYAVTALRGHLAEDLTYGVMALRARAERKRSQEELRRSEAYLSEAQRLSHTGSFGWSVLSGEISWSDETFRIFEYDRASKPTVAMVLERVHPEDIMLVRQTLDRASRDGKDWDLEHRLLMPDGRVKHLHVLAHALHDASGNLEFVGAVTDNTATKQAEEALRESEEQWKAVFEHNPTMYFMVDAAGTILSVNPFGAEQLGYTVDALAGSPVLHVFYEADREAVRRNVALCFEQLGRTLSWECRKVRTDGTVLWVRETARAMLMKKRPVVLIACEDITERKRAEAALRRSEAYLAEAQRLSHTGSWARDLTTGEVTHVSGESFRLFGFDPDRDRPSLEALRQRIHPEDRGRVVDIIEGAVRARTEFEVDFRTMLPDSTIKYLHGIGHPVVNGAGDPVEYIGTAIDVTERKHREEERERLLASERAALAEAVAASEALQKAQAELAHVTRVTTLGELATSIAHEINQPLSAIVTNGSACLRWLAGAAPHLDDAREALQCIIDDGQRASAIITRIRALLRKTATAKVWLDINHLVHEVVRLTQQEIVRQGVALRLDLATDLPPMWGDWVQLQQVLLNLVLNGIEAMARVAQRPRELVIRVRPEAAGTVLVAVEDTGVGIAPEQLDAMFTAFYTTKAQGLGMGLAISRTIIEQHGGRLWAVPHDGPGATVQFTLVTDHGEGAGQGHKASSGAWTTWQGERR